ncbi:hypothetical protein Tco_0361168 [Tanacetum coccineum]
MSAGGIMNHRRGMPFNRSNTSSENYNGLNGNHNGNGNGNTDLFSRNRTSVPVMTSSDESNDLQARLARLSVGSAKPAKSILDDLLVSNEGGKNDYDWSSSPCLRVCPTPQPINHTDFSYKIPPNLRTTLPDWPLSAGRSRPVGSTTVKEPPRRGRPHVNGHTAESLDPRRTSHLPDLLTRKPIKSSSQKNVIGGFGRNISKKSLDMAIKHMDIRNGGPRLSGSTLFPQSIRSNNSSPHSSKPSSEVDIYESSRYSAILLQEDLKNTSWLHSADDKIDEGSFFDNGFESLPEPFRPL